MIRNVYSFAHAKDDEQTVEKHIFRDQTVFSIVLNFYF